MPRNATGYNTSESTASPTLVDPIARAQRCRPEVFTFIFASTKEFANSPTKNAVSEANTIRGVCPKTSTYACWPFHEAAGGRLTTTQLMNDMNMIAPKPAQTTLRALAY